MAMDKTSIESEAKRLLRMLGLIPSPKADFSSVTCRICGLPSPRVFSFRDYSDDDRFLGYVCYECLGR